MATILIIDDQPTDWEYLVTLLAESGHRLLQGADGDEALAIAQAEHLDLVIADILMPTMDGSQLIRRLRADPVTADIPVIFCTLHYHEREARALAKACGVAHVLTKPGEPEVVLRAVKAALGLIQSPAAPQASRELGREPLGLLTAQMSEKVAQLRIANARSAALIDLGLQLGSERDLPRLLHNFCRAARKIIGARYAIAGITTGDGSVASRYFITSGMDAQTVSRLGSPDTTPEGIATVLREARCLRLDNPGSDPVALGFPSSYPPIHSWLGAPIVSPGRVHGWLGLIDKIGTLAFSDEDERVAGILTAQVGRIYENVGLYADLRRHAAELEVEVAERQQAAASLKESEERFRQLAETIREVFWLADPINGKILYVSPAYEAVWGRTCESLYISPYSWLQAIHLEDRERVRAAFLTKQAAGGYDEVYRIARPDGSVRWIHDRGFPVRDAAGEVYRSAGVAEDVTERRRAEQRQSILLAVSQALAESSTLREAAHKVLQATCDSQGWELGSIWTVDRQANVLRCVEVWQDPSARFPECEARTREITFAPGVGLPGRVWLDRRPAWIPDIAKDLNFPRAAVATREGLRAGFAFPILFGEQVLGVVEFFSSHFREPDSDLLQVSTGISGPLGQFMERKQAEESLRESEEHIHLLLDSTAEAIYGIDLHGHCTFANPACARILGYADLRQLLGRDMHALIHHMRADGTPYPVEECRIFQAFQKGEESHVEDEVLWRADGSSFPAEYWSYPIRSKGQIVGSVVTFLDITERRRLEDQIRQAQKMEAVGRLAGGVAHDFNNLLQVITGYGELLRDALRPDDPSRELVGEMTRAAERAAALTRQLLAFSRQSVLAPRVLDLNAVVLDLEKMLRRVIGEDVELATGLQPGLDRVKVDPGQVEQVLMNLAVNARDAMPTGGKLTIGTANVELDEEYARLHAGVRPGPYVLLAVSDTGSGMTPEVQARIFEPFFTTKELGKGTGLGLATVFGIVQQAGGHVAVYSEQGVGSSFKVYLPRVEESASRAKSQSVILAPPKGTETVLLVEDEDAVRALTRIVLREAGYRVLEAADGGEALAVAGRHEGPIHLLLSDVVMPVLGGRQLAERLLALQPDMKVLFQSGYTDDAVVRHGVLQETVHFLQKPFTPRALALKVREVLDSSE